MRDLINLIEGVLNEREDQSNAVAAVMKTKMYVNAEGDMVKINNMQEFMKYIRQNYTTREIGRGHFSIATIGDPDSRAAYILKTPKSLGAAKKDTWPAFAKMAQKEHKNNSLYPKILAIESFDFKGTPIHAGLVEFLEIDVRRAGNMKISRSNMRVVKRVWESIESGDNDSEEREIELARDIAKNMKVSLEQLGTFLVDTAHIGEMDIHEENVGWRRNGEIVIFDPTSFISPSARNSSDRDDV